MYCEVAFSGNGSTATPLALPGHRAASRCARAAAAASTVCRSRSARCRASSTCRGVGTGAHGTSLACASSAGTSEKWTWPCLSTHR